MKPFGIKRAMGTLVLIAALTACEKTPVDLPDTLPPQQHLPNPLPEHALLIQLKQSALDFQTFSYNYDGQVSEMRSQWQYIQGDPTAIKTIVYNWTYDQQQRPVQQNTSSGLNIQYVYNGNRIDKTRELYPDGSIAREVQYLYGSGRVVEERWRVKNEPEAPDTEYKHVLSYDTRGNLAKVEVFEKDANAQFQWLETVEYRDFDNAVNPSSWMLRHPHLPQFQWQYNNPGREIRRTAGGEQQTLTYTYTYNHQGLPKQKSTGGHPGGTSVIEYIY